ncbi:MAG: hypothetical protein GY950_15775, partial [bacterium]|nr:hypothetical protein [bacterium]
MTLRELLLKNRSYRRFYQEEKISIETLKEIVENVRFTPSASNKQPYNPRLTGPRTKKKAPG